MRPLFSFFAATVMLIAACIPSHAEDIQIGLSSEAVAITSNFDGAEVAVFGTIVDGDASDLTNARYSVVVALSGPDEDIVVRRKEKRFGIWLNGESMSIGSVPSFYSIASSHPLERIADTETMEELQLGYANLTLSTPEDEFGSSTEIEQSNEFRQALTRLKASKSLLLRKTVGVKFLSPTLFRARLSIPANVPIGRHTARAYLLKDGVLLAKKSARLSVRKSGFEQYTYNFAHRHGFLYGVFAVFVAMATGWLASIVFRKD